MASFSLVVLLLLSASISCEVALQTNDVLFYADHKDSNRTHAESEIFCASIGGVVPTAKEHEYPFLRAFLPHHRVNWCYRVAGHRSGEQYLWNDGTPFNGVVEPNHCIHDCRLCIWKDGKFVVSDGSMQANAVCQIDLTLDQNIKSLEESAHRLSPSDASQVMVILASRRQAARIEMLETTVRQLSNSKKQKVMENQLNDMKSQMEKQDRVVRRMKLFMDTLHEKLNGLFPASGISWQ